MVNGRGLRKSLCLDVCEKEEIQQGWLVFNVEA